MITIKQKLLAFWLVITMLASVYSVIMPTTSYANHAICYDGTNSIRFIEECTKSEREKNNIACYENNNGNNDAIAECVRKTSEHHNATGSKSAAENAPALPSDAMAQSPGNFGADCKEDLTKENCGIVAYIVQFTNLLSGLVGLVVVIMLAYGGIRYTASKDNPQETSAAKEIIRNAVIALVGYLFVFAFLQYIIPGGIF